MIVMIKGVKFNVILETKKDYIKKQGCQLMSMKKLLRGMNGQTTDLMIKTQ